MGGTATAGTVITILRAITKAADEETIDGLRRSCNAYFFTTTFICAFCFVLHVWVMPRMPIVKYWRNRKVEEGAPAGGWGGEGG